MRRSDLRNESGHLLDLCRVSRGYRSGLGLCLGRTPLFLCISHADKKRIGFFGSSPPAKTIKSKKSPRKALRAFRGVFYFPTRRVFQSPYFPPAYFRFFVSVRYYFRPFPSVIVSVRYRFPVFRPSNEVEQFPAVSYTHLFLSLNANFPSFLRKIVDNSSISRINHWRKS